MAAEMPEKTPCDCQETEGNRLEHVLEDIHEILRILRRFATPEAGQMLDSLLSSPAMRWKQRRK